GLQAWLRGAAAARGEGAGEHATVDEDARFSDQAWQQWPYRGLREGFKATEDWWREASQVEGMSRHHRHMVEFFARQGVDALSPSNCGLSNPTVLNAGLESL